MNKQPETLSEEDVVFALNMAGKIVASQPLAVDAARHDISKHLGTEVPRDAVRLAMTAGAALVVSMLAEVLKQVKAKRE
jgi:hypothetical protein